MRIYIFKSEIRRGGFSRLRRRSRWEQAPESAWTLDCHRVVRPEADPLHKFSRLSIERAIDGDDFQLWRLSAEVEAPAVFRI